MAASVDWISVAYSLAVTAGGLAGYVRKGSLISGLMGVVFGGLAGFGAYQLSKNPANYHLSLGTSVILMGVMGKRWISSGSVMPAGVVAAMSFLMVARLALRAIDISNGNFSQQPKAN